MSRRVTQAELITFLKMVLIIAKNKSKKAFIAELEKLISELEGS